MNAKAILKPALALFVICLVATILLALTNSVTTDKIDAIAAEAENTARFSVFPEADTFSDSKEVGEYAYYEALDASGRIIGYTFTTAAKGYGGDVSIMTGVRADGSINGIEVLDVSNETPGLGQNAKKESFKNQFTGKSGVIGVSTASKAAENGIDALTGATYTSGGVAEAVNLALTLFTEIPKGGADIG